MSPITWTFVLLAGATCVSSLGQETTIYRYPSLVQIEDRVGVVWLQQCLGSILTSYHVLSAASCFGYDVKDDTSATRRIRYGTSQRGTGGVVVEITRIQKHPSWGLLGNDGDILIARVAAQIAFGPGAAQGPILGQGIDLPVNLRLSLATWGTTTEGGLVGNDNLYELQLYVVINEGCMEKYLTATNPQIITENMICTGLTYNSGRDSDSRDYGAPLFYDGIVVAVSSFGVSRGNDEFPIVTTSVASYSDWIVTTAVNL